MVQIRSQVTLLRSRNFFSTSPDILISLGPFNPVFANVALYLHQNKTRVTERYIFKILRIRNFAVQLDQLDDQQDLESLAIL